MKRITGIAILAALMVSIVHGERVLALARTNFFPSAGGAGTQRVELNSHTKFRDVFYFARPELDKSAVLTLHFVAKGFEQPIQVRFNMPENARRPAVDRH